MEHIERATQAPGERRKVPYERRCWALVTDDVQGPRCQLALGHSGEHEAGDGE